MFLDNNLQRNKMNRETHRLLSKPEGKKVATVTTSMSLVLRYIFKSCKKDGESLFSECAMPKSTTKDAIKVKKSTSQFMGTP